MSFKDDLFKLVDDIPGGKLIADTAKGFGSGVGKLAASFSKGFKEAGTSSAEKYAKEVTEQAGERVAKETVEKTVTHASPIKTAEDVLVVGTSVGVAKKGFSKNKEKEAAKETGDAVSGAAKGAETVGETAAEATKSGSVIGNMAKNTAKNFVEKHPLGAAAMVGIPAVGVMTGHGDAVLAAPGVAIDTAGKVIDGAFTVGEKAAEGGVSAAGGIVDFVKNNSSWLLPVAGIAGAGLLLGKGGLGGVAKLGLLGAGVFAVGNVLKSMKEPANQAIENSMEAQAGVQQEGNAIEKATDAMFGKQEVREKVDTSQILDTTQQSQTYVAQQLS